MRVKQAHIYGLLDPHTRELRYIGKSMQAVTTRVRKHVRDARRERTHKANWLRGIYPAEPIVEVFDTVPGDGCAAEVAAIGIAKALGCRLTNMSDGGDGTPGHKHTEATKALLRAQHTGMKASAETKRKMSEAHLGVKLPPFSVEHRAKLSAVAKARVQTEASKAKRRAYWAAKRAAK